MRKKTFFLLSAILFPVVTVAQIPLSPESLVPKTGGSQATGNIECFDYYKFGSVQADLQPQLGQTVPGATLYFSGKIVNDNDYPLVDGKLSVKIFRQDGATFEQGNGNPVVDQFVLQEKIQLDAKGEKPISFEWKVPKNTRGGEYYAGYFFTTSDRYNLMGLSFTDDVLGNQSQFTVTQNGLAQNVEFDKNSVFLNDKKVPMAAVPLHFQQDENVTLRVRITNPTKEPKTLPLQWNQYSWDAQRAENRKNTKTELITLLPNESREVQYMPIATSSAVNYITATLQDGEAKSFINVRYVKDGIEETRINFPSLTSFPIESGKEQTLFACAHSTNMPLVKENTLVLTLKDKEGGVISQHRYQGDISGAMSGFGQKFTPKNGYDFVTLEASLFRGGNEMEKVEVVYDCNEINASKCGQGDEKEGIWGKNKTRNITILGIAFLGILTFVVALFSRRARMNKTQW